MADKKETQKMKQLATALLVAWALYGCAQAPLPPVVPVASTLDESAITARIKTRCPETDKKDLAELQQRPKRPAGDKAVDKAEVRGWIDRIEASQSRTAAAGMRIAADYERCRQGAVAPPPAGT